MPGISRGISKFFKNMFDSVGPIVVQWLWGDNGTGNWGDNGTGNWGDNL
jgi:hypothetical protein